MLMSLCTSEDHEVVKAAARALGRFSAHRATAALLGLLAHERWDVRWTAAEVLADRGDVTALHSLRHAMEQESDSLVRQVLHDGISRLEGLTPPGRGQ
jgi:HEAT repeat protein